ncbi:MAG: alpha/beta hydrolase family protein [Limisphaerales bacterium]
MRLERFTVFNCRKFLTSADAGFWGFLLLALFGSMIWAKSRDPFARIWFTVKTPHYGKIKGVAVLPKPIRQVPVVLYVYGSGGSLITSGNHLRQLAELGMAAVAIEYNQTNELAFAEEFTALREWTAKQKWASANAEGGTRSAECWIGFSLGAQRTLDYLLKTVGATPTVAGGTPALPLPQLYVRLAGGVSEQLKIQNSKFKTPLSDVAASGDSAANLPLQSAALLRDAATKVLLVHGENDEVFPVSEAKEVAASFPTNGVAAELKILPGQNHTFGENQALVMRIVGEYVKAHLTPEHPQPEFPVTKDFPFLICIAPAFAWIAVWIYLRRKNIEHPTSNIEHPKLKKWEIALRVTAIILATLALAQTAIHLVTPRLKVSETTLKMARKFLIPPKWKEDFETLAAQNYWRGQKLKTLLTHVELSNYCVYELINWKVDKKIYNEFVLSPVINSENDSELNWRRPLWEFFYPRIRKENDTTSAAEIIVRNLRQRVTISMEPSFSVDRMSAARSGIESIWQKQIADPKGFERIYVAALRSCGVPARLHTNGTAEFWTGSEWKLAPRPLIESWR